MKTIEMTNQQLAHANQALVELMKVSRPVVIGLALRRLARQIAAPLEDFSAIEREIIERHARRDDNGQFVPGRNANGEVQPGTAELADPETCRRELTELHNLKVRVSAEPLDAATCAKAGPDAPAWVWLGLGDLIDDAPAAGASERT